MDDGKASTQSTLSAIDGIVTRSAKLSRVAHCSVLALWGLPTDGDGDDLE